MLDFFSLNPIYKGNTMTPTRYTQNQAAAHALVDAARGEILQSAHDFLFENNYNSAKTCSKQIASLGNRLMRLFQKDSECTQYAMKDFYDVVLFPNVIQSFALTILNQKIEALRTLGVDENIEWPEAGTLEDKLAQYTSQKQCIESRSTKIAITIIKEDLIIRYALPVALMSVDVRNWVNRDAAHGDLGTLLTLFSLNLFHLNSYSTLNPQPRAVNNHEHRNAIFILESMQLEESELDEGFAVSEYLQRQHDQLLRLPGYIPE